MIARLIAATLLVVFIGSAPAAAQEEGQVGLVMGYPAAVGLQWQASDRVAIRPEITLSGSSGDVTSATRVSSNNSSWTAGFAVSALFYVARKDGLRTYVSPRFSYVRSNSTSAGQGPPASESENTGATYSATGSFGAQYLLAKRFSVFGEVGFSYGRQTSSFASTTAYVIGSDGSAHTWGTRSTVGVIVYFH
ncbi:MAG TPA: hypothetical protein VGK32_09095 [Vicinamibacterales bacterium]|jgi:hypothetical protein